MYQYDRKGPKRGIALYSYSAEFGLTKSLEECFEDIHDMGAHGRSEERRVGKEC